MPDNKIALDIIKTTSLPIAAPSANLSGKPSITNGKDAYEKLNSIVPLILDAGQCRMGIESTVLNLTSNPITILREGVVTKKQIEDILRKRIEICKECDIALSPRMKYKHYSPKATVYLAKPRCSRMKTIIIVLEKTEKLIKSGKKTKVVLSEEISKMKKQVEETISPLGLVVFRGIRQIAHEIFKLFREPDRKKYESIVIEGLFEDGIGSAVTDKIKKHQMKRYRDDIDENE
jgi:L-threonylcarbamoyladenylate synthase